MYRIATTGLLAVDVHADMLAQSHKPCTQTAEYISCLIYVNTYYVSFQKLYLSITDINNSTPSISNKKCKCNFNKLL